MSRYANIFLIFCLNAALTYFYIYFVVGSFSIDQIYQTSDKYNEWQCTNNFHSCFLPDIIGYHLAAVDVDLQTALIRLAIGATAIHAAVLGYFFDSEMLYSALVVNSAFIAITMSLYPGENKKRISSYLLLSPFFVFSSVGWTKEIIMVLSFSFFLRSAKMGLFRPFSLSLFFSFLARPQFIPVLIVGHVSKHVSEYKFVWFLILIMATSPFWLALRPDAYANAYQYFQVEYAQQGISVYTDYLKENIPILSIIGYLVAIMKLYFEPIVALLGNSYGFISVITLVQFYALSLFLFTNLKALPRFGKDNKIIFNLFLVTNIFICSLQFTHFRYVLPILIALILYQRSSDAAKRITL